MKSAGLNPVVFYRAAAGGYEVAFSQILWELAWGELSRKLCLSAALSDPRISESS
jgi:hypothetical protein